jgi:putative transposase
MSGKRLFGKDGTFAPMLKNFIEKALEAEMEGHLNEDERSKYKCN